ncbi:MAG: HU family DNA-binding protein [Oscillatoriales cyanobacterium SM2_2_1]|nr:HU family DNA-binding protein [Oscillatoriales cyanobacterium SM2_2_1]
MNKGELVDAVASKTEISKKSVEAVISAAVEVIIDAVAEGDRVTLVGFGSFEPRIRQEREGRNPRTGEKMVIPETKVPAFSAGKVFKDRVLGEEAED